MKPAAGWYTDPQDHSKERYFNGQRWTSHVRNDVPDIPLAPWMDTSNPYLSASVLDTTPPRTARQYVLPLLAGAVGVAAVTVVGVSTAMASLEVAPAEGIEAAPPPSGGGGQPVAQTLTCDDVESETESLLASSQTPLVVQAWAGNTEVIADYQPVTSLPPADDHYLLISCEGDATFDTGELLTLHMEITVDSAGDLYLNVNSR